MSKEPLQKIQGEFTQRASAEQDCDNTLRRFAAENIQRAGAQWNYHSLVTLKRQVLSRILYVNELYQKIVDVPGGASANSAFIGVLRSPPS
jgi:hypothetical protein